MPSTLDLYVDTRRTWLAREPDTRAAWLSWHAEGESLGLDQDGPAGYADWLTKAASLQKDFNPTEARGPGGKWVDVDGDLGAAVDALREAAGGTLPRTSAPLHALSGERGPHLAHLTAHDRAQRIFAAPSTEHAASHLDGLSHQELKATATEMGIPPTAHGATMEDTRGRILALHSVTRQSREGGIAPAAPTTSPGDRAELINQHLRRVESDIRSVPGTPGGSDHHALEARPSEVFHLLGDPNQFRHPATRYASDALRAADAMHSQGADRSAIAEELRRQARETPSAKQLGDRGFNSVLRMSPGEASAKRAADVRQLKATAREYERIPSRQAMDNARSKERDLRQARQLRDSAVDEAWRKTPEGAARAAELHQQAKELEAKWSAATTSAAGTEAKPPKVSRATKPPTPAPAEMAARLEGAPNRTEAEAMLADHKVADIKALYAHYGKKPPSGNKDQLTRQLIQHVRATDVSDALRSLPGSHETRLGAPAAGVVKPSTTAELRRRLDGAATRDEAHALLAGYRKAELVAHAKEMSIPRAGSSSAADLRSMMVEATTGNNLDSWAIRGGASLPYGETSPTAERSIGLARARELGGGAPVATTTSVAKPPASAKPDFGPGGDKHIDLTQVGRGIDLSGSGKPVAEAQAMLNDGKSPKAVAVSIRSTALDLENHAIIQHGNWSASGDAEKLAAGRQRVARLRELADRLANTRRPRVTAASASAKPSASEIAAGLQHLRDNPDGLREALDAMNLKELRAVFRVRRLPEPGSRIRGDRPDGFILPLASQRADAPKLRASLLRAFGHYQTRRDGDLRFRALADEVEAESAAVKKPPTAPLEQALSALPAERRRLVEQALNGQVTEGGRPVTDKRGIARHLRSSAGAVERTSAEARAGAPRSDTRAAADRDAAVAAIMNGIADHTSPRRDQPVADLADLARTHGPTIQAAQERYRNARVELTAQPARALAEIDRSLNERGLVAAGNDAEERHGLRLSGQLNTGSLQEYARRGNEREFRAELDRQTNGHGLVVEHRIGDRVPMAPGMVSETGRPIAVGAPVEVVQRGSATRVEGELVPVDHPIVREVAEISADTKIGTRAAQPRGKSTVAETASRLGRPDITREEAEALVAAHTATELQSIATQLGIPLRNKRIDDMRRDIAALASAHQVNAALGDAAKAGYTGRPITAPVGPAFAPSEHRIAEPVRPSTLFTSGGQDYPFTTSGSTALSAADSAHRRGVDHATIAADLHARANDLHATQWNEVQPNRRVELDPDSIRAGKRSDVKRLRSLADQIEGGALGGAAPSGREAPPAATVATSVKVPRIDENVSLKGDPEGDHMRMHGDSLTMGLAKAYARVGRNGSANQMMDLRRRATTSGADGISPQQVVDELRAWRAREQDPAFQQRVDRAIRGIDAPMTPMPDLPANTPPLARQLIEDLHAIPYARKGDGAQGGGGHMRGPSLVDQLADVYRDAAAGRRDDSGSPPSDRVRSILRGHTHEINEAAFRIWELERRLDTQDHAAPLTYDVGVDRPHVPVGGFVASPLAQELRQWERGQLPSVPATAAPSAAVTAGAHDAATEGAGVRMLNAANLTPKTLRELGSRFGIDLPTSGPGSSSTGLESRIAREVAKAGRLDELRQAIVGLPSRPGRLDPDTVAERITSLNSVDAIVGEIKGINQADLRRVAAAINLPAPAGLSTEQLARYIAENIVRDRTRWSLH